MVFACPLNFNIKEDCCISAEVDVNNVDSKSIINNNSITSTGINSVETFIKTAYFDNGNITTSQDVKPVASVTVPGTPGPGLTAAETSANSTDIAGQIGMTGTPGAGSIVLVAYANPFPVGSHPTVILTPATDIAANCVKTGVYAGSANNYFTVAFTNALATGANPVFNYSVTCPLPAS